METNQEKNLPLTKFKLISFYKEEWDNSKKLLLKLKEDCQNNDISLEEKFQKLSTIIQIFEKQNGDEDYNNKYLKNNCINLKEAIKNYFGEEKKEKFYKDL